MSSKRLEVLLKKYWSGKTSLEEEKELKSLQSFSNNELKPEHEILNYLNIKQKDNPLDDKFDEEVLGWITSSGEVKPANTFAIKYWYVAASIALVISLGIVFNTELFDGKINPQVEQQDTFEDPELAFEETKKALLLLSSKLNQGSNYAAEFSKFEKSQNQLKQN